MKLGGRLDISLAEYKKVKIRPTGSPWKQLALVSGKFVFELKKAYSVLYVAKFSEAIYVIHAFEKKTQKTSKADLDLASNRYRQLANERKKK